MTMRTPLKEAPVIIQPPYDNTAIEMHVVGKVN